FTVTNSCGNRPCSINFPMADGTVLISLTRLLAFPSRRFSHHASTSSASTTVPPQLKVAHNSKMERSKQIEVAASTPPNSSSVNVLFAQAMNDAAFLWVSITPLGTPEEPEV